VIRLADLKENWNAIRGKLRQPPRKRAMQLENLLAQETS
jgi:hypothetical protein